MIDEFMVDGIMVSDSSTRSRHHAAATRRWAERVERFPAGRHAGVAFCAAKGTSETDAG
jgi:hypothetical protein